MRVDRDLLTEYALGLLTPEQEAEVVRHLRAHPEDAAYVRDVLESLGELAMTLPPEPLPEGSEAALLARVRQRPEGIERGTGEDGEGESAVVTLPPRPRRTAWWLGLAAAAAILVFGVLSLLRQPAPDVVTAQLEQVCAEPGAVCAPLLSDAGDALGTLARRPDGLFVVLDAPPPAGRVYQAWAIVEGVPESLGVFETRVLDVRATPPPGSVFGITVEPPGGSPQPTSTPIALEPLS